MGQQLPEQNIGLWRDIDHWQSRTLEIMNHENGLTLVRVLAIKGNDCGRHDRPNDVRVGLGNKVWSIQTRSLAPMKQP